MAIPHIYQRSDGGKDGHHSAQKLLTIGETPGKTLSLSNLYTFNHGKSGVTMRRVAHTLTHSWSPERQERLSPRLFLRTEPRLPPAESENTGVGVPGSAGEDGVPRVGR